MAYPQPNSNAYATNGYPFFRLNTPLVSPGDIYESEQGATAFAIGPESDIANVRIFYLDDQDTPTLMNDVVVGADRGLVGLIYARMDATYLPSKRPGRLFMAIDDLYDPNYRPSTFDSGAGDTIDFVTPILDVIQYFKPPDSLTPQRNDRTFYVQEYALGGLNKAHQYRVIPYYGRKYASICVQNGNATDNLNVLINGLNYAVCDNAGSPHLFQQEVPILPSTTLLPGKNHTTIVTAGRNGMFDALVLSLQDPADIPTTGAAVIHIVLSDTPGAFAVP